MSRPAAVVLLGMLGYLALTVAVCAGTGSEPPPVPVPPPAPALPPLPTGWTYRYGHDSAGQRFDPPQVWLLRENVSDGYGSMSGLRGVWTSESEAATAAWCLAGVWRSPPSVERHHRESDCLFPVQP